MTSPTIDRRFGLSGNTGIKAPCLLATTGNITLNGEQTIDGVTTSESRVLVWQQTSTVQNGLYDTDSGAWTRCPDANDARDLAKGTRIAVTSGTTYAGYIFQCTTASPVPGSTAITFTPDSTATTLQALLAGTGSGQGASQIGVQDAGGYYTATTQEAVNAEIAVRSRLGVVNLEWPEYSSLVTGNDYTAALAAAVATGKNVYVPWRSATRTLTAGVTFASDYQVVFSDSPYGARFQMLTTLAVIFGMNGRIGCGIRNLWLEGPVSISASPGIAQSYTQSGVFAQTVTHCFVEGCRFSGWEGGAVFFQDATACRVVRNTFTDAKTQPAATDNFGSADIVFWKSCVDNVVAENIGESGASYHVILQTVTAAAQTSLRNKIINNTSTGNKVYGIMVYNILASTHVIESTVISGNTIRDVSGFYNNPASGLKDYGAGIYLLSCEKTICTNNIVENACTATAGSTLTPAGISANGVSSITISNNRITTSAWYGIWVTDTLQIGVGVNAASVNFVPSDYTVIEGNTIKSTTKHGIYVRDKHKVRVVGNTVDTVSGASQSGIVFEASTANYPTLKWLACDSNSVYSVASTSISFGTSTGPSCCNNQIEGATEGIFLETIDATVVGNNVRNIVTGAGRGIDLRTTSSSTNSMISGNTVTGCTVGILASHPTYWGENRVSGNTTNYSGLYAPWISGTFNPPSIAAAGTTTTTLTVTGAVLGDFVDATFSLDLQGIQLSAYVNVADTVTFVFQNPTAGAIDLASGTIRAKLRKV